MEGCNGLGLFKRDIYFLIYVFFIEFGYILYLIVRRLGNIIL